MTLGWRSGLVLDTNPEIAKTCVLLSLEQLWADFRVGLVFFKAIKQPSAKQRG